MACIWKALLPGISLSFCTVDYWLDQLSLLFFMQVSTGTLIICSYRIKAKVKLLKAGLGQLLYCEYLQWRTKILGMVMENLSSTSCTYQIFRYSIICTSLATWIPRMARPPLPNNVGMKKLFWDRVKCTALQTLQLCLGGSGGKGEKFKADHVNCP